MSGISSRSRRACHQLKFGCGSKRARIDSRLLTCLHPNPLADDEMETGFEILLDSLDDLCFDIPDAKVS